MCISTPLPLTVFPRSSSSHILTKTVLYHFMRLAMYCGFLLSLSKINSLSSFLLMTSIISLCFLPFFLCLFCFFLSYAHLIHINERVIGISEFLEDNYIQVFLTLKGLLLIVGRELYGLYEMNKRKETRTIKTKF